MKKKVKKIITKFIKKELIPFIAWFLLSKYSYFIDIAFSIYFSIRFYKILKRLKERYFFEYRKFRVLRKPLFSLDTKKQSRKLPLIVSLTSYGKRIKTIELTLKSLLYQTEKADKILLWLSESEFKNKIPIELKPFEKKIDIRFCKDYKSYKKIIPTLKAYPKALILTADDDILYPKDWIKNLYNAYLKDKSKIHCYQIWRNGEGFPKADFPVFGSGCGVIFTPQSIHKDVFNFDLIKKLAITQDDLMLSYLVKKNGFEIKELLDKRKNNIFNIFLYALPFGFEDGLCLFNTPEKRNKDTLAILKHYEKENEK